MNKAKGRPSQPLNWWLIGILATWGSLFYRIVVTTTRLLKNQPPPWDIIVFQTGCTIIILVAFLRMERNGDS